MQQIKTEIGDVRFNAQTGKFEALVTFHKEGVRTRVAAEYEAPITTDFEAASRGLWHAALRQIGAPASLRAQTVIKRAEPTTPGRLAQRFLQRALPEFRAFWFSDRAA